MVEFGQSLAVVVGVDAYARPLPSLRTAVADATAVARVLAQAHGYTVELITDAAASRDALVQLLEEDLPRRLGPDDRLVFYFAGHGLAEDGDDGPEGWLLPADAGEDRARMLPMARVAKALRAVPSRHRLLVFDCCFSGAFRWSSLRNFAPEVQTLHEHRYARFVRSPAAQVLTSAAEDQVALDSAAGLRLGRRLEDGGHSPFAAALLRGLEGAADQPGADGYPDGVITATELYQYVRDAVEVATRERGTPQTPGLWPLPEHERGEFLFAVPGKQPRLAANPRLDAEANPWPGAAPYAPDKAPLFFGRGAERAALSAALADAPAALVVGPAGSGKTSLLLAGGGFGLGGPPHRVDLTQAPLDALPAALDRARRGEGSHLVVLEPLRPLLDDPEHPAWAVLDGWAAAPGAARVATSLRPAEQAALPDRPAAALLRAHAWALPAPTREALRQALAGPAEARVLYFEPAPLLHALVDQLVGHPSALPLLSACAHDLYRRMVQRDAGDRALRSEDLDARGGVAGHLPAVAQATHAALAATQQAAFDWALPRLWDPRPTPPRPLTMPPDALTPAQGEPAAAALAAALDARLLVDGPNGVQPTDPAWATGWAHAHTLLAEARPTAALRMALASACADWRAHAEAADLLWDRDPRRPDAEALGPALSASEARFLAASASAAEARRRLRWRLVAAALAVALLGGVAYWRAQQAAAHRAADARAARLAAERQAKAAAREATQAQGEAAAAEAGRALALRLKAVDGLADRDPALASLHLAAVAAALPDGLPAASTPLLTRLSEHLVPDHELTVGREQDEEDLWGVIPPPGLRPVPGAAVFDVAGAVHRLAPTDAAPRPVRCGAVPLQAPYAAHSATGAVVGVAGGAPCVVPVRGEATRMGWPQGRTRRPVRRLTFSGDGRVVFVETHGPGPTLMRWPTAQPQPERALTTGLGEFGAGKLFPSPSGQRVVLQVEGQPQVLDLSHPTPRVTPLHAEATLDAVSFSGERWALLHTAQRRALYDLTAPSRPHRPPGALPIQALSPRGGQLAVSRLGGADSDDPFAHMDRGPFVLTLPALTSQTYLGHRGQRVYFDADGGVVVWSEAEVVVPKGRAVGERVTLPPGRWALPTWIGPGALLARGREDPGQGVVVLRHPLRALRLAVDDLDAITRLPGGDWLAARRRSDEARLVFFRADPVPADRLAWLTARTQARLTAAERAAFDRRAGVGAAQGASSADGR